MKQTKPAVQIVISGEVGAGKSTILHHIGLCLKNHGFNVSANDDHRDRRRFFEGDPLLRPDDRDIHIVTSEEPPNNVQNEHKQLAKMLRKLCSHQHKTSEEVSKDWDDARLLLKSIGG